MAYITVLFAVTGISFLISSGTSPTECVYANSGCSTALATWLIVLATSLAFIAAYEAAIRAGEALKLETRATLGQALCCNSNHEIPRTTIYVASSDKISVDELPDGFNADLERPLKIDFENLGRSALLDIDVEIRFLFKNRSVPQRIHLGNIASEKDAHIVVLFAKSVISLPRVGWSGKAWTNNKAFTFPTPRPITLQTTVKNLPKAASTDKEAALDKLTEELSGGFAPPSESGGG